ncbi:hypothetical protein O5O45_26610 [Hahella aquimaris]|uniref:hypothetical protein n=1 Tax=Hahella sp. HNIBRBA332 TaxID=3015983 RepID=UPI00273BC046|nr:hypothetical protein [Hahella sp. HNIBRBA332]WLQ13299.1 hypothetical protein O5O45_26610 [Hahella sp. HNIBRBA332]
MFRAITPRDEEDFYFLIERSQESDNPTIDDVKFILVKHNCEIRELLLFRAHTRHYYCIEEMPFSTIAAKLSWRDVCPPYLQQ